eukprot:s8487_g3.t1
MRGDRPEKEYQVDQFMYRSRCFIYEHVQERKRQRQCKAAEGMSGREASTYLEPWLAHFGLSPRGDTKPSFYSDPEPLTINIAQALAERYEGHSESFAPERHAPVSRSSKEEVDAKYARGVYLGPVLGSTGHQVRIRLDSGETKLIVAPGLKLLYPLRYDASLLDGRLDSGETKLIVAPGLKLLYPLRYDASLLDGAKALEGFVPPLDEERFRELHLPYVPGGGPSKEWIREHGGTPRCPGCSEEATSSRHSVRCVRRYQRWLRDAVDNALEELDRDPPPPQGPPAKRVRFGDSEVREFSAPSAPSEGEASPLEPTLFSGWVQLGQKWTYIIALAYVDDLLIVSDSQEGVEFIHKSLSAVLKVKVTGRLHEDGQLEFEGRLIKLDGNNITLGVKPEYVRSVFSAFGWTEFLDRF